MARSHQSYLEAELSGEEDPVLAISGQDPSAAMKEYKVPPGIQNLAQWGTLTFSEGKYENLSFSHVFETEKKYVKWMSNRKVVKPCFLSFQNYVIAREKQESKLMTAMQPKAMANAKTKSFGNRKTQGYLKEGEWDVIHLDNKMPGTSSTERTCGSQTKRSAMASITPPTTPASMTLETDPQKVHRLQAQIAILQRELAREIHVPEEGEEAQ